MGKIAFSKGGIRRIILKNKFIFFMLIALILSVNISFALSETQLPPVELVSPKMDGSGGVVYSPNVNITLKLNTDVDALMTIVRIDEPRIAFSKSQNVEKIKRIADNAPTLKVKAQKNSTVFNDPVVSVDYTEVYAYSMGVSEIQNAYVAQAKKLKEAYENYNIEYAYALSSYDDEVLIGFVDNRLLLQNNLYALHTARQDYEEQALLFNYIQAEFESLFRVKIIDDISIKKEGALPFFNLTLKDVSVGKYEIVVKDRQTGEYLIDAQSFYIKSQEQVTQDLLNSLKDDMTNLWNTD